MVTTIQGTATVPDFYISEGGKIIRLRPEDLESAVNNAGIVTYVDSHIENSTSDIKGIATSYYFTGSGIDYDIALTDEVLENEIIEKREKGEIPNVSAKLVPMPDAEFSIVADSDGNAYTVCNSWQLKHISNVEVGRCKPEDGCGVFNYNIQLSDFTNYGTNEIPVVDCGGEFIETIIESEDTSIGETMTECMEAKLKEATDKADAMFVELSELKETNVTLMAELDALKTEKSEMNLVLSETKEYLETLKQNEYDAAKDSILKLDAEYPLKGDESIADLELVLTALRRSTERRKSFVPAAETAASISDTVAELKALTGRRK